MNIAFKSSSSPLDSIAMIGFHVVGKQKQQLATHILSVLFSCLYKSAERVLRKTLYTGQTKDILIVFRLRSDD
jgi:hypothetical protein